MILSREPSRTRIRIRSLRTVLVLAVAVLLLAACGVAEEPAGPDLPETDPPAVEEPVDDEPDVPEDPAVEDPDTPVSDRDCSAQGTTVTPVEVDGMPAEVAAARDFLIDAAVRCDEQLLFTAIEESSMFTFSFGDDTDVIGYWWDLEEAGEEPFLRLAQVLSTTPALADGGELYVWPQVATGRSEHTTEDAWAELTWMSDADMEASQTGEGYVGWRAGISLDGEWRYFLAGD